MSAMTPHPTLSTSPMRPLGRHWLNRLVLTFVPTWHHMSGYPKQPWRVEYWPSDDRYKASLHLHWNCLGRAHWLCVFLPEWSCPNDKAQGRPANEDPT